MIRSVRHHIGQRNQNTPLHEKYAATTTRQPRVKKEPEVRPQRRRLLGRRQPGPHEKIARHGQSHEDEAEDAHAPRVAQPWQGSLEDQGEYYAADRASRRGEARGESPTAVEEVANGCIRGIVEEGAAEAHEDGEGAEDLVVL